LSSERIRRALDEASRAATSLQLHLAWKQLECAIRWPGEVRYRPDQPRAPRGTPIGGQWIDDLIAIVPPVPVADAVLVGTRRLGARCDGFSAGCQNGGSFGTSAIVHLEAGRRLCWDCAIKWFGLENETEDQKWKTLTDFDRTLRTRHPR
jgi:hypothetical protein